jgi:NAD(P)-dependent dehydrogenase (short-subunit alcohol dehydrogenase family)
MNLSDRPLVGKRALVVGASSGIGQGIARSLSAAGAHVALAARRLDRLEQTAAECAEPAVCLRCDVTEPGAAATLVEQTVAALGGLDVVVYSSGTTAFANIEHATADDWQSTLATNVVGPALVFGAALPHLRATSGHGVYLSSVSARFWSPWRGLGLYVSSKRAAESVLESLRLEAPEVAFTTLVVGPTVSEFGLDQGDTMVGFAAEWFELGQVGPGILDPADHGGAIVNLLAMDRRVLVSEIVIEPRRG